MVREAPPRPVGRPVHPAVRVLLAAFVLLTAAGCTSLLLLAERTDELFAWTIQPPLTAAFLGAGYGAGLVLSFLAVRTPDWHVVRVPFLTVLVFTWLTTAATVVHADRLHMSSPGVGPFATPAAWVWIMVYAVVPPAMTVALVLQRRAGPGPRTAPLGTRVPLPRLVGVPLAVEGATMGLAGAALLLAPARTGWWPWELTPFTARAVAAWLLAFGLAAVLAVRSGDLRALRLSTIAYTVFGLLQLVASARHGTDLTGPRPAVAAWLVLLVAVLLTGAGGWSRAPSSAPDPHRRVEQRGHD